MNFRDRFPDDVKTMKMFKFFGPLLLAISGMLITYGALRTRLEALETYRSGSTADQKDIDHHLSGNDIRLTRLEDAVAQLPEMRGDIKEILRELHRR